MLASRDEQTHWRVGVLASRHYTIISLTVGKWLKYSLRLLGLPLVRFFKRLFPYQPGLNEVNAVAHVETVRPEIHLDGQTFYAIDFTAQWNGL